MLFGCENYDPEGGMNDLKRKGNDIDDLIDYAKNNNYLWWHIFDTYEMKVIEL
jgi:hypothetical protein